MLRRRRRRRRKSTNVIKKKDPRWERTLRSHTSLRAQLSLHELAASCWTEWPVLDNFKWFLRPPQSGNTQATQASTSCSSVTPPEHTWYPPTFLNICPNMWHQFLQHSQQGWCKGNSRGGAAWRKDLSLTSAGWRLPDTRLLSILILEMLVWPAIIMQFYNSCPLCPTGVWFLSDQAGHVQAGPCCLEESALWNMPRFCTEEIWYRAEAGSRSTLAQTDNSSALSGCWHPLVKWYKYFQWISRISIWDKKKSMLFH